MVWAALWLVCGIGVLAYATSSVTSVMTTLAINGPGDLPGKTIGVFSGSVAEDFAQTFGLHYRSYPGIDESVTALHPGVSMH